MILPAAAATRRLNGTLIDHNNRPRELDVGGLGRAVGSKQTHVPYRGGVLAVQDTPAGRVPISIAVLSDLVPRHPIRLRILAVTSECRIARLEGVPTVAEAGFPQLTISEWMGRFAPARTPAATVAALRQVLDRFEFPPMVTPPGAFTTRIRHERDTWARVVRQSGFQPET